MFLAAALFLLAGVIECATALAGHHAFLGIGIMFLAVGTMWMAIGATYRRREQDAVRKHP
jgi:hypothetical protein